MRPEPMSLRTWLLMGLAAWAVVVALLALVGLGTRITPLAYDPAHTPRLPQPAKTSPERLGVLAQYSELVARPPFYENRRPQPFYLTPETEAQTQTFDYVLTSVLLTPGLRMAILQPSQGGDGIRIKEGEASSAAPQWTLVEVQPRAAIFEGPDGQHTLELRVFDGSGGQTPTASTVAPPAHTPVPQQTGGTTPAMPRSPPPASGMSAQDVQAEAQAQQEANAATASVEQQMDDIRKRIEARRAQMRQQQGQNTPAPSPVQNQ